MAGRCHLSGAWVTRHSSCAPDIWRKLKQADSIACCLGQFKTNLARERLSNSLAGFFLSDLIVLLLIFKRRIIIINNNNNNNNNKNNSIKSMSPSLMQSDSSLIAPTALDKSQCMLHSSKSVPDPLGDLCRVSSGFGGTLKQHVTLSRPPQS